jgi:hypothetical protein
MTEQEAYDHARSLQGWNDSLDGVPKLGKDGIWRARYRDDTKPYMITLREFKDEPVARSG